MRGQHTTASGQKTGLSQIEESLEIARRSMPLEKEANALAEESLKNQKEILEAIQRLDGQVPVSEI